MFKSFNPGAVGISANFEQSLKLAAQSGFDGVDLPLGELTQLAEKRSVGDIRRMFSDAGLRPGGWGLPVNFRTTQEEFEKGMEKFPALARLAGELGAPWCATWLMPCSEELDYRANFEMHARRLRRCAQVLRDHDCRLGLEFVGPWTTRRNKKYPFVCDMPGLLKLADAIGTGNVGLLLDCWHWYTAFGDIQDILRLQGRQVVYVHVNDAPMGKPADEQIDSVRTLPGATGAIDIVGFLKSLDLIGFDGPVVVEPFSQELRDVAKQDAARAAKMTGDALNKVWTAAGLE
jgi:sugar phosphate isomerase/epimerase